MSELSPNSYTQSEFSPQQLLTEADIRIRYESFEDAKQAEKKFSDDFIDTALAEHGGVLLPFSVGSEMVGLKGYLDKVEATATDRAIIEDPEAIASVYTNTTQMIARSLKIRVTTGTPSERIKQIAIGKNEYLARLDGEATETAAKIVAWAETGDPRVAPRPGEAFGYYGFNIGEGDQAIDVFDQGGKSAPDFRPNIKIQRQGGGNFIYGYSDSRVIESMEGQRDTLTERIYLNPDLMATPEVFESVLSAANEAGIPLELKMFQRSEELGAAHIEKSRDPNNGDALRGDGLVIYTSSESANDVLELALAIAKDRPEAFAGRETSRIPQAVAEGIAVGSKPRQKSGQDAREAFRRGITVYSEREGIRSSQYSI